MMLRQLFDPESSTFTYLLADPETRVAALVDPVRELVDRDLGLVDELGLTLGYVLETHVHADHVTGAALLRRRTGAKTAAGKHGAPCTDVHLDDGDLVHLGGSVIQVIATPGHTDDSVSYLVGDKVLTGDALLIRGAGRTDFQNGDANQLYQSITTRLFTLPDDTQVFPGHDYRGFTVSTIGEEKRWNPRIAGKSRAEFCAVMQALNLPPPRRLEIAVPANRLCGEL